MNSAVKIQESWRMGAGGFWGPKRKRAETGLKTADCSHMFCLLLSIYLQPTDAIRWPQKRESIRLAEWADVANGSVKFVCFSHAHVETSQNDCSDSHSRDTWAQPSDVRASVIYLTWHELRDQDACKANSFPKRLALKTSDDVGVGGWELEDPKRPYTNGFIMSLETFLQATKKQQEFTPWKTSAPACQKLWLRFLDANFMPVDSSLFEDPLKPNHPAVIWQRPEDFCKGAVQVGCWQLGVGWKHIIGGWLRYVIVVF